MILDILIVALPVLALLVLAQYQLRRWLRRRRYRRIMRENAVALHRLSEAFTAFSFSCEEATKRWVEFNRNVTPC